jgi:hypothetical protein
LAFNTSTADELTLKSIRALVHREVIAIVLRDLRTPNEDLESSEAIRALSEASTYRWKSDLTVVGVSVGEAHESAEAEDRYFSEASETARLMREVIFPTGSPVSRIAEAIRAFWPAGVHVPTKNGRAFLPEIARRWVQGGGAHPHIDQSQTPLLAPLRIRYRVGVNHYVNVSSEQGATEFWDRQFTDEEYLRLKRSDYGLDRALLGEANLKLRPARGSTVLFRAWEPHAVESVAGHGDRITNAAFLGFEDFDRPLLQFA